MKLRITSTVLWTLAGWAVAGAFATFFGVSPLIGPFVGAVWGVMWIVARPASRLSLLMSCPTSLPFHFRGWPPTITWRMALRSVP